MYTKLKKRLPHRMNELGITQAFLAKELDVAPSYISQVITGVKKPSLKRIEDFAKALDCSVSYLLGFEPLPALDLLPGIEEGYLNVALEALYEARTQLLLLSVEEALQSASGKEDTKRIDVAPEEIIRDRLFKYNPWCSLITEEHTTISGKNLDEDAFIVDPLDRSTRLVEELQRYSNLLISEVFKSESFKMTGLGAPFGSITLVRKGKIVFNVLMDYHSGDSFVACKSMAHVLRSPKQVPTMQEIYIEGQELVFPESKGSVVATYLGNDWPKGTNPFYSENAHAIGIISQKGDFRNIPPTEYFGRPPGPARILYLSNAEYRQHQANYVVSNGEKLGEFLGWLAWAMSYKSGLVAYEAWGPSPIKNGVLMSPGPVYSAFKVVSGEFTIDWKKLEGFENPSLYRGSLIVVSKGNTEYLAKAGLMKDRRVLC